MSIKDHGKKFGIRLQPITFDAYNQPNGWLTRDLPCHGLFYYALIAKNTYEQIVDDPVLVGEKDPHADFRQLFKSVAFLYGCEPERMANYWHNVRMQFRELDLTPPSDVVVNATTKFFRATDNPSGPMEFTSLKELEEKQELPDDLKKFGIDFNNKFKKL